MFKRIPFPGIVAARRLPVFGLQIQNRVHPFRGLRVIVALLVWATSQELGSRGRDEALDDILLYSRDSLH